MLKEKPTGGSLKNSWRGEIMVKEEVVEGKEVDLQTQALEQVICCIFKPKLMCKVKFPAVEKSSDQSSFL